MSNDKTTLADVKPGGWVRLGDGRERARFQEFLSRNPLTALCAGTAWEVWQAALSAQPSPGGQGEGLAMAAGKLLDVVRELCLNDDPHPPKSLSDAAENLQSVLACRSPLGPCNCCGGTGYVDDGEINCYPDGTPYECGPVKCIKDCPSCAAHQPVGDQHPDDLAVDAFAAAMKAKMAEARAKGRGGWEDPAQCTAEDLSRMLRNHVEKGDPRDVANFCMMLHQRGEAIAARQPVGEPAYNSAGISLTACQLHEALLMAGDPELDVPFEDRSLVRIFWTDTGHSGPGLYCECVGAEEEGCILLDGTAPAIGQSSQAVDLAMPIAMIDQALGHLSTALDDLDSSPDARPGAMVTEAMGCLRQALTGVQP